MGTTYMIKISQASLNQKELTELKLKVEQLLLEINNQMSTWDPQSFISRFNQSSELSWWEMPDKFQKVFYAAYEVYQKSEGAFDPTVMPLVNFWGFGPDKTKKTDSPLLLMSFVGMDKLDFKENRLRKKQAQVALDFSAIAKGFGVDEVADLLINNNLNNFFVEIGGEVVVRGQNEKRGWRVGIEDPLLAEKLIILEIGDNAVATSGDYRNFRQENGKRFSHTIDPKKGAPVEHSLASVSVVHKSCMMADALATAIMVMGKEKGLAWLEKMDDAEGLFYSHEKNDLSSVQTTGFQKYRK
jgi:thiamine biosynthesis lipoprotein